MAPVRIGGWNYRDRRWTKGIYVVTRSGTGLKAVMPLAGRSITIGTSTDGDVPAFLDKLDGFIHLKETVYA